MANRFEIAVGGRPCCQLSALTRGRAFAAILTALAVGCVVALASVGLRRPSARAAAPGSLIRSAVREHRRGNATVRDRRAERRQGRGRRPDRRLRICWWHASPPRAPLDASFGSHGWRRVRARERHSRARSAGPSRSRRTERSSSSAAPARSAAGVCWSSASTPMAAPTGRFGHGGAVNLAGRGSADGYSVAIQPDGKILAGGAAEQPWHRRRAAAGARRAADVQRQPRHELRRRRDSTSSISARNRPPEASPCSPTARSCSRATPRLACRFRWRWWPG